MKFTLFVVGILFLLGTFFGFCQEVPIINYSVNNNGQAQLEVVSNTDNYYIVKTKHTTTGAFKQTTAMAIGLEGTTVITEVLGHYPLDHYQVFEHPISNPVDTDNDGIDDIIEYNSLPNLSPFNFAPPLNFIDGALAISSLTNFKELSVAGAETPWAPFIDGKEFVKFVIVDIGTPQERLYFVNSETHYLHLHFMNALGIDWTVEDVVRGEIIYHPTVPSNNGTLGVFSFAYSEGFGEPFEIVQQTNESIAANMPFLKNNLSYFVTENSEDDYFNDIDLFNASRVAILLEADVYADIDFLAINSAEGFGRLRIMDLEETPSSRDIVLYQSVPNNLPRVGGIITSFLQTPLSHINLRAIQDNIPNAFIRDPLESQNILNLVDRYIYYKVAQNHFEIREATLDEVNEWHDATRPSDEQLPPLNLEFKKILPLEEITFTMSDGFGAKCTNVATMQTFDFPENTIPNGFGVPFYFYQEFMKFNGFFEQIDSMLATPEFQNNIDTKISMLKDLRRDIKDADMPQWMLDELQEMHESFPPNTSIRVRSSTNNEDLPGFNGAGLYTSKTQKPDEGHIKKSVKQVYASLWNYRAFDEREYYRVDQHLASMGLLCHPNYKDEKANGVGISTDPIYQTENTFYLNTQVGEDLITNPEALSIPEEILLDKIAVTEDDYIVIRYSNQTTQRETLIMDVFYLDQLREYLSVIHDRFKILYNAQNNDTFAMDIEYKITSEDQFIIKQARPWAAYLPFPSPENNTSADIEVLYYPNPTPNLLTIECDCSLTTLLVSNTIGQLVLKQIVDKSQSKQIISLQELQKGLYFITGLTEENEVYFSKKIIKN